MNYGLATMQGPPGSLSRHGGDRSDPSTWGNCMYNSSVIDKARKNVSVDCRQIGHGGEEYGYLGTGGFLPAHDIAFGIGACLSCCSCYGPLISIMFFPSYFSSH